jgi:hypothetical protein
MERWLISCCCCNQVATGHYSSCCCAPHHIMPPFTSLTLLPPHSSDRLVPTEVTPLAGRVIVAVAGGWRHTLALDEAGTLFAWGWCVRACARAWWWCSSSKVVVADACLS